MKLGSYVRQIPFAGIPLLGNLANGSCIGLSPEGAEICARAMRGEVPDGEIAAVDERLLACLQQGGFGEGASAPAGLVSAYLHVTNRCNLSCAGCYSADASRNAAPDPDLADVLRAVRELAAAGVRQLIVSGGEPFLRGDLLDIVRCAKAECGIASVVVLTNGLSFGSANLTAFAPFVDTVSISFDGCSGDSPARLRGEQRFDALVEAVRAVRAAGMAAHMLPTLHALNAGDMREYAQVAEELGATLGFSLLSCEPAPELQPLIPGDAELKAIAEGAYAMNKAGQCSVSGARLSAALAVRASCGAGVTTVSVAADGAVYPCHMLHRGKYRMGNVFSESLASILGGSAARSFAVLSVDSVEGCAECRIRYLCGGGCRARSEYCYGSVGRKDPYCALMKGFYSLVERDVSEMVRANEGRG